MKENLPVCVDRKPHQVAHFPTSQCFTVFLFYLPDKGLHSGSRSVAPRCQGLVHDMDHFNDHTNYVVLQYILVGNVHNQNN